MADPKPDPKPAPVLLPKRHPFCAVKGCQAHASRHVADPRTNAIRTVCADHYQEIIDAG